MSFRERASAVETAVDELRRDLAGIAAGAEGARFCVIARGSLASAIAQVSFAIADPAVRAELGAVWVEATEDSLRLVATDSHPLGFRDLVPEQIGSGRLRGVIDTKSAAILAAHRAGAGPVELSQDDTGEISTTFDGCCMRVGHSGTEFPDYEQILSGGRSANRSRCPAMP